MKEVFEKEVKQYGDDSAINYIAEKEITVTITLNEYRELVSVKALKDKLVADAEKDKWARENENSKLKEENAVLKAELYELQKNAKPEEDDI